MNIKSKKKMKIWNGEHNIQMNNSWTIHSVHQKYGTMMIFEIEIGDK